MARKRTRQGGAEAFMDLAAMLPRWAGAFVAFFRRRTRPTSATADALAGMPWREFELLVGEAFRMQGYTVIVLGGAQSDGFDAELVVRKGRDTFLVQCKQWKALTVGVDVLRRLHGAMAAEGAAGGFVVTSGTFTEGAHAFSHGRNLMLVDGPKLFGLIQQAKASLNPGALGAQPLRPGASLPAAPAVAAPQCPACDASMVRRTALKGTRAGSQFWGCSRFPVCRGTR